MQESFASKHGSELVPNTLEELLNRSGVSNKGRGHLQTTRRNRANCGLDVVWNPLYEITAVLVLNIAHLVLDLLNGDFSTATDD